MRNLVRNLGQKVPENEREELIAQVAIAMNEVYQPDQMYIFGSALTSDFDEASDVDILVVFADLSAAGRAWRLHKTVRALIPRALDVIVMDRESFERKKHEGAIAAVAFSEGRRVK